MDSRNSLQASLSLESTRQNLADSSRRIRYDFAAIIWVSRSIAESVSRADCAVLDMAWQIRNKADAAEHEYPTSVDFLCLLVELKSLVPFLEAFSTVFVKLLGVGKEILACVCYRLVVLAEIV